MRSDPLIVVRGGGDLATGTIHRLARAGFRVLVLETAHPAAIRRFVALSEAVYDGKAEVEGVTAVRIGNPGEARAIWEKGEVPLLVDPEGTSIRLFHPDIVVDAIIAKRNLGTNRRMAPLTIGLGPGFTAGTDVDLVIETVRGHNLGRIIREGTALPDTHTPGVIGGYGAERVIHAPEAGILRDIHQIGDFVEKGEAIARVENAGGASVPVPASLTGLIRGLIRDGYPVTRGFKIADIDPRRSQRKNCYTISDKARCIAGSVLEAVCAYVRDK